MQRVLEFSPEHFTYQLGQSRSSTTKNIPCTTKKSQSTTSPTLTSQHTDTSPNGILAPSKMIMHHILTQTDLEGKSALNRLDRASALVEAISQADAFPSAGN